MDPRGPAPPRSDIDVFMRDEGKMTNHPRIGIRPTIDGRRKGVREALEEQTMNMAKSVADLFTENLRYRTQPRRGRHR